MGLSMDQGVTREPQRTGILPTPPELPNAPLDMPRQPLEQSGRMTIGQFVSQLFLKDA